MIIDTAAVNGFEMSYFKFGSGKKTFVILPGIDIKSILQSAIPVEAAYKAFSEDYTVFVFDRRLNMPEGYSVADMADDTAAVMSKLGIKDAYIFGASQGGMIAMCIAIRHPELARAMVLGSTAAYADEGLSSGIHKWIELAQKRDLTALTASFIDLLYSENTLGQYRDLLMHMNDKASDEDISRFITQAKALKDFDIRPELGKISCPTLVIGSLGDKVIPPECSRMIADAVCGELYMYPDEYGHCVFDEAPDYKRRIAEFFEEA